MKTSPSLLRHVVTSLQKKIVRYTYSVPVNPHAFEQAIYIVIEVLGVITDPHAMQLAAQATEMNPQGHASSCASTATCLCVISPLICCAKSAQEVINIIIIWYYTLQQMM